MSNFASPVVSREERHGDAADLAEIRIDVAMRMVAGQLHRPADPVGLAVDPQLQRLGILRCDPDGIIDGIVGLALAGIETLGRHARRVPIGERRAIDLLPSRRHRVARLLDPDLAGRIGAPGRFAVPALSLGQGAQPEGEGAARARQIDPGLVCAVEPGGFELAAFMPGLESVPRLAAGRGLGGGEQRIGLRVGEGRLGHQQRGAEQAECLDVHCIPRTNGASCAPGAANAWGVPGAFRRKAWRRGSRHGRIRNSVARFAIWGEARSAGAAQPSARTVDGRAAAHLWSRTMTRRPTSRALTARISHPAS
jgi:hypothetical protein